MQPIQAVFLILSETLLFFNTILVFSTYKQPPAEKLRRRFLYCVAVSILISCLYAYASIYLSSALSIVFLVLDLIKYPLLCFWLNRHLTWSGIYIPIVMVTLDSIWQIILIFGIKSVFGAEDGVLVGYASSAVFQLLLLLVLLHYTRTKQCEYLMQALRKIHIPIYIVALLCLLGMESITSLLEVNTDKLALQRNILQVSAIVVVIILMFVILVLMVNNLARTHYRDVSEMLEKQVQTQVAHYESQNRLYEEYRRFRHDFNNHMHCIESLARTGSNEQVLEYITELNQTPAMEKKRFDTGNYIVDAILSDKEALAAANDITFTADGFFYPDLSAADTCIVLANALDNALEACRNIDMPRFVTIHMATRQSYQAVEISNSCALNCTADTTKTSKSDCANHGLGFTNIARTVRQYNGTLEKHCENGVFTLSFTLKIH